MNRFFKFLNSLFTAIPLRMMAIIGAGVIASAFLAWLIFDLMYGRWSAHAEAERIRYLGWYGFLQIGIIGVVVAALTSSKIKGTGPAGLAFEIESTDPQQRAAKVTTTTTVETPKG